MKMQEYESEMFDISVAADRLTAIIALLNEHYFNHASNWPDNTTDRVWWCASYGNLQDVMGVVLNMAVETKKALETLADRTIDKEAAV